MTPEALESYLDRFAALLQDAVASGASVGFLAPLDLETARSYWRGVAAAMRSGQRLLWAAFEDGMLVGTVQLQLASQPNAQHRAEVMKLIVDRRYRRRGIGSQLLRSVEEEARRHSRTLLVLDTRSGDPAENLYRSHGYLPAGSIPDYARAPDGSLHATQLFYKSLNSPLSASSSAA